MILLAVDPGANGGIAAYTDTTGEVVAIPYPETEGDVLTAIRIFGQHQGDRVATVEAQVGVMGPNIKVSSAAMFTFGRNYGFMLGALQALGWKIDLVRPMAWHKELSMGSKAAHGGKTAWKNHLKAQAQRLYPNLKVTLKTADALLILEYAKRVQFVPKQQTLV